MNPPDHWEVAIAAFLEHKQLIGLADETIKEYGYRLRHIASELDDEDPWAVSDDALRTWFNATGHLKADTRRGYRTVLRGFYRWAVEDGHVDRSPALNLRRVPAPPPNPRPVPGEVYAMALRLADARERLMLRLGGEHGLRRGEISRVHSRDLIDDLVGWSLMVHGKGGKQRIVPLTPLVAHRLRELPEGYAFPGGQDGHISPWWVGRLLSRLLTEAYTGHKLRHKAAADWRDLGGDLDDIRELLGHASLTTTRIYVPPRRAHMRALVEGTTAA